MKSRPTAALAAIASLGLLLTACGGGGDDSVPAGPSPVTFGAGCGTPVCAFGPSAKCNTRAISALNPAGPPAGLGVNAEAPVRLPATACVPSRTSDGLAVTAGLT